MVDFFTPFKAFDSALVKSYHTYIMKDLPEIDELPAVEIPLADANQETVYAASKGGLRHLIDIFFIKWSFVFNVYNFTLGYTIPVVIRGALKDLPATKQW